jgi:hypothetical protein
MVCAAILPGRDIAERTTDGVEGALRRSAARRVCQSPPLRLHSDDDDVDAGSPCGAGREERPAAAPPDRVGRAEDEAARRLADRRARRSRRCAWTGQNFGVRPRPVAVARAVGNALGRAQEQRIDEQPPQPPRPWWTADGVRFSFSGRPPDMPLSMDRRKEHQGD